MKNLFKESENINRSMYELHSINGISTEALFLNIENKSLLEKLNLTQRNWRRGNNNYTILRYNKEKLSKTNAESEGLFRSIVLHDGNIVVFSPPKSLCSTYFKEHYPREECIAEEFVEGTMINLFYDSSLNDPEIGHWEITTRSSVGGELSFYSEPENINFRQMFLEACVTSAFNLNSLPKEYTYSFVLQHPHNRIVTPFTEPKLYLICAYDIDNETKTIKEIDRSMFTEYLKQSKVKFPECYIEKSYQELAAKWANDNTDYKIVGVVIKHKDGCRTKFRNPTYEKVRYLRGNQPKLQYRYLSMRQEAKNDIETYLKYYPEDTSQFTVYRKQIHNFTETLYKNYLRCKVKKEISLRDMQYEYRNHIQALHDLFHTILREQNKVVTRSEVIRYVNRLPAARLMYSINYPLNQQRIDEHKANNPISL